MVAISVMQFHPVTCCRIKHDSVPLAIYRHVVLEFNFQIICTEIPEFYAINVDPNQTPHLPKSYLLHARY